MAEGRSIRPIARAGVDNLDESDLRYRCSYIANFMHQLILARTAGERERIIAEAAQFLEDQQRQARLEAAGADESCRLERLAGPTIAGPVRNMPPIAPGRST